MFLLGIKEEKINWENTDYDLIKENLFRLQKLSSKFYEFRLSSQASIQNNFQPFLYSNSKFW